MKLLKGVLKKKDVAVNYTIAVGDIPADVLMRERKSDGKILAAKFINLRAKLLSSG
jgi:hypothetical protein